MSTARFGQHVPDILDCLAQLSNDEVPTPPKLARAMLDLLPDEVWSRPDYVWLDPFSKSGVFLRESATRLLDGLADWEPDFVKRREHIFRTMLHGTSITEMTGIISRRSLYCSADASGTHSVVRFDDAQGNLPFVPAEHDFGNKTRCTLCNAPAELEREGRENYAYSFIHGTYPTQEMASMKFDVIVGNPPYQIDSDGNTRTMPIYQRFVEQAIDLNPRYVLMITPSRWFAGGLGLAEYRQRMLNDNRIRALVDYRVEKDAFPGVNDGGVSYFLWDRAHQGPCEVTHVGAGSIRSDPAIRYLNEFDLLVRDNRAVEVLRKVRSLDEPVMTPLVSSQKPYGLHTNEFGARDEAKVADPVLMHGGGVSWVPRSSVQYGRATIDEWKVLIPAASDGNETFPAPIWDLGRGPFVAGPGEICNGSYLVVGPADNARAAEDIAQYLRTRFVRFLVSLRKIAQHNKADCFDFVPQPPADCDLTDDALFKRYGITSEEELFIESQVKLLPPLRQADA